MDSTTLSIAVAASALVVLLRSYYRWLTHHSIRHIRGPAAGSQLLGTGYMVPFCQYLLISMRAGNIRDIAYQENVGDLDWKWMNEYGTAWRLRGALGVRDHICS